ncbi:MAG: peptide-methionine (S)-S-oxide reductase MsrA [Alphaproteobacteria bacterium]|jgi:peptide-methionine (S)-S-oxide reductase|nr:peptide-methionine (S)-S-oxide reductase MsrA [Alphaproteobacteria bacterium]MDP6589029.1 peptide-methionine (S)-S-oxide reductase MsrA [Alphaproteobacteria bacterium]MDP6819279.1 peptide-methionine (S)-S-oxide reductase MsrA [Alphaproteobacteria bacterium]
MSEKATFAAGCFWKPEYIFRQVEGVVSTSVGYMGGEAANPSYEQVCSGRTGHAEVVRVEYDPERVSYEELLDIFWHCHDPSQRNRQGPDIGTQYRSAVFAHGAAQEEAAAASRARLAEAGTVVTEIAQAGDYWPAEDYHQQYIEKSRRHRFGAG